MNKLLACTCIITIGFIANYEYREYRRGVIRAENAAYTAEKSKCIGGITGSPITDVEMQSCVWRGMVTMDQLRKAAGQ